MTRRPIWWRTYCVWHLLELSTWWGTELPHGPDTHPSATFKIQYIICTWCSHVKDINNFHRTKNKIVLEIWLWNVPPISPIQMTHSHPLWSHVIWYTGTNILEEHAYSIFKEENQVGHKIILLFHRIRQQVGPIHWYVATHNPVDSNCHGHCCQTYKSYKSFPGLRKNRLTISVSRTLSKSHSRLIMDTSCQTGTPIQQMKHQVCEHICIITGSNGQLLLYVMAHAIYMALLIISYFLST